MSDAFRAVLSIHVLFAIGSALAFWVPVFTTKGSTRHVRAGRWYFRLMLLATSTAILVSALRLLEVRSSGSGMLIDPFAADATRYRVFIGFLIYIAIATATAAIGGVRALRRGAPRPLDALLHRLVAGLSLVTIATGAWQALLPMIAVGAAGLLLALVQVRAAQRVASTRVDLVRDHVTGMIGSGIGIHSALSVVVFNRMAPEFFHGPFGLAAWLLPAAIGVPLLLVARVRLAAHAAHPA